MSKRPTQETDARAWSEHSEGILHEVVEASFARKLELERDEARAAILATLEQNRDLADGDDCTLAKLKSVVPDWK